MNGLTKSAAHFVANLRYEDIPPGAADTAAKGIADCASVILLGLDEPVTSLVAGRAPKGSDEAWALWGKLRTSADYAALLNATAAHSLDYDDTCGDGHPSAVLFPAVLALGEGSASGKDILSAYIAGYEVWGELASREQDKHHAKGFHPSGIFGAVGAAAACSNLLGLDEQKASAALSISASMSAGLVANFGTMTKPYQLARAAQSGVLATQLAALGMTAAGDALEHTQGFLAAYSPAGRTDLQSQPFFGQSWRILTEGLNVKLYPVCYAAHRVIDSAIALAQTMTKPVDAIRSIRVYLGRTQSQILRFRAPCNSLEAKFSAEFAAAAAILTGSVSLRELHDDYVNRADVRKLMTYVQRIESDEVDPQQSLFSPADRIEIEFADGEIQSGPSVRFPFGHARNPADRPRLAAKFEECSARRLSEPMGKNLFSMLCQLQDVRRISEMYGHNG